MTINRKIRCFEDLETIKDKSLPVVTLFSGGLDSSYLLAHMFETGFTNIYALCIDLGEGIEVKQLEQTSKRFGAQLVIKDAKATFANNYVSKAINANAKYLNMFPVSSSLARPLMAKLAVELAREVDSNVILHTANQSQNSLRRINTGLRAEGFSGLYGSPYEYSALSREDKAAHLATYNLSYYIGRKLSGDANIWCREFESGPLDNPESFEMPEDAFVWSLRQEGLLPTKLELSFVKGALVAVNGKQQDLLESIAMLNHTVGSYGHGRYVGLEHLDDDEKVLEVREAPAAFVILQAIRHLETATLSSNAISVKQTLESNWTIEAVEGRWSSDLKCAADAAIASLSERVSGTVVFDLNYQSCLPNAIRAEQPLYLTDRDTWEIEKAKERGSRRLKDMVNPQADTTPVTLQRIA